MRFKRILFGLLVLSLLSCNFVTQIVAPPTPTPTPTSTPTSTPTATPSPTPTPLVPAHIPQQCAASPLATVPPEVVAQSTLEFDANPTITSAQQSRILRRIGEIVREVYVYPDYNGRDWDEIEARYRAMIESGLDTESFYREMQNMIFELGDEHSTFISPVDAALSEAELKGNVQFVGVGIYGWPDYERGRMIVISVFPGSPAAYAGIKSHDSILLVDGLPIEEVTGSRMRGPECSALILTVQSPGESPRDVILFRSSIEGNIPIDARLVPTNDGSRVGYIFIPSFFDETLPPQIEEALHGFGQLDGLILDLRVNGGGSSTVAYPILEFFTDGRLGQFVSRRSTRPMEIHGNPVQNSQTVPLVIMVSEETVSFGEIFAGVLRDAGRAKIVGQTSLGNVEVLHSYTFEDGSVLWIASETFISAFSDDDWEEIGIIPDVFAHAEWDTFLFETDPAIAASLELLGYK